MTLRLMTLRLWLAALAAALVAGCAVSPKGRVQSQLQDLGVPDRRAECMAEEFDARLDGDDLDDVAEFLDAVNRNSDDRDVLDVLRRIDNPRAAGAAVAATATCAFRRG